MFIEKLSKEEFEELALKFFQEKGAKVKKINKLQVVLGDDKNTIIIRSKNRFVELNDFCAEYGQSGLVIFAPNEFKSQIIRDYLYLKFGEEYLTALKKYLEHDKTEKVEKLKNELEEKNKKSIAELVK